MGYGVGLDLLAKLVLAGRTALEHLRPIPPSPWKKAYNAFKLVYWTQHAPRQQGTAIGTDGLLKPSSLGRSSERGTHVKKCGQCCMCGGPWDVGLKTVGPVYKLKTWKHWVQPEMLHVFSCLTLKLPV